MADHHFHWILDDLVNFETPMVFPVKNDCHEEKELDRLTHTHTHTHTQLLCAHPPTWITPGTRNTCSVSILCIVTAVVHVYQ